MNWAIDVDRKELVKAKTALEKHKASLPQMKKYRINDRTYIELPITVSEEEAQRYIHEYKELLNYG